MPRQRDIAVDILKFFAVFLIINSHADMMYPRMSALATGGAIGDCIFLFVSGYTLFLGQLKRFDNYYKRRINRIFPSVAAAVLFIIAMNPARQLTPLELAGGEFIVALMIYYVLLYLVQRFAIRHIPAILAAVTVISVAVYILWFPDKTGTGDKGMYGITTLYRWIPFFGFMLGGAYTGLLKSSGALEHRHGGWFYFLATIANIVIFYGIQLAGKIYPDVAPLQIITLLPLAGIVYSMYRWCGCGFLTRLYNRRGWHFAIMFVSGLCLESYLIQFSLFTRSLNHIWPLNLIIIVAVILAASYAVRCLARFFAQTFRTEDYDWRAIFNPL